MTHVLFLYLLVIAVVVKDGLSVDGIKPIEPLYFCCYISGIIETLPATCGYSRLGKENGRKCDFVLHFSFSNLFTHHKKYIYSKEAKGGLRHPTAQPVEKSINSTTPECILIHVLCI